MMTKMMTSLLLVPCVFLKQKSVLFFISSAPFYLIIIIIFFAVFLVRFLSSLRTHTRHIGSILSAHFGKIPFYFT